MKSSSTQTGKTGPGIGKRLSALLRRGKKKTHRLSANVTGEEDWEVDEPQIRMSRAFAVMLVLHLVAVGGLFAFHVFGKDDREAELTATRAAHDSSPPVPAKSTAPLPAPAAAASPRAEILADNLGAAEQQKHVFKAGETRMLIAAKFGVTVRELEEANPTSGFKTGDSLVIPPPQRIVGALADNKGPVNPPLALIVASPSDDIAHRDFSLKKGTEDPYAPVEPAELAAMTPERPAGRTKAVRAEPEISLVRPGNESPDPEESAPAPRIKKVPAPVLATPAKPKPAATGSRTHVVGKGDTIYNVARRYKLSPNEIMRSNGIGDPSRLQMGQVLKITVRR